MLGYTRAGARESRGLGHTLAAKKLRDGRYTIEFGCVAGGHSGDGGEWNVAFGAQGEVLIDLHTRIDDPHHWGIAAIEFMERMCDGA